jgi:hypothetical protein
MPGADTLAPLLGDEGLYQESLPAFGLMGKKSLLLGAVGAGARMKLVVNMVMGAMMGERQDCWSTSLHWLYIHALVAHPRTGCTSTHVT